MDYRIFATISLIVISCNIFAQHVSPYNNHYFQPYERYIYQSPNRFHTAIKPYNIAEVSKIVELDTLYTLNIQNKHLDYALNKDLYSFKKNDFGFTINPAVNFELSKDTQDSLNGWINTRGFIIDAQVTPKVFLSTSFFETQSYFRDYRKGRVAELGRNTIPGQSRAKGFGKDNKAQDYAFSEAYISYVPNDIFGFQLGHGKHFIGDGYRSILLSDNAMSYPYFKITTNVWNLKYINMWSQHQYVDVPHLPNSRYPIKWNAMHYLDWSVTEWLSIGFFETIIWENEDTLGNHRGFELQYLNPVIFLRPVEFSIGSPDNVMMGLTGKLSLFKNHIFYGQVAVDEFKFSEIKARNGWWGNKFALQGGYKTFDIAGVKHLDFQTELNLVRPFMYSHFTYSQQYGHALQSLAHPRGANFYESATFLRYNYQRFFAELKFLYVVHGKDTTESNYGNDIFKLYQSRSLEYDNKIAQGAITNKVFYTDFTVSYLVHPKSATHIMLGLTRRAAHTPTEKNTTMMYFIGLRSLLHNFYYDF